MCAVLAIHCEAFPTPCQMSLVGHQLSESSLFSIVLPASDEQNTKLGFCVWMDVYFLNQRRVKLVFVEHFVCRRTLPADPVVRQSHSSPRQYSRSIGSSQRVMRSERDCVVLLIAMHRPSKKAFFPLLQPSKIYSSIVPDQMLSSYPCKAWRKTGNSQKTCLDGDAASTRIFTKVNTDVAPPCPLVPSALPCA